MNMLKNQSANELTFPSSAKKAGRRYKEPPKALQSKFIGNRDLKLVKTPQKNRFEMRLTNNSFSNKDTELGIRLFSNLRK